jgi:acyl carrier protein
MIPVAWQVLMELPLTANGKIDRLALQNIKIQGTASPPSRTQNITANNKQERIILEIWQKLLQRENIGIDDNFFDVGGHSLLLAQVQEKLEQSFLIDIAITDLFKYPSISSLANYLSQQENDLLTTKNNTEEISNRIDKQKAALARRKKLKGARK